MNPSCRALFLAIMLLTSDGVLANDQAITLTLEQLIAEALEKNPEIRALKAGISAAEGEVTTAGTWANPELTASPGVLQVQGNDPVFHGEIGLTQTFEFPGKRALRRAVAEKGVESRRLALDGFRFQLTIQVRRAYYAALAWHEILALKEQQLTLAERFAASARNKVEHGFAPEFEATKAEVEVVGARRALRETQAQHRVGHAALNTLVGRRPGEPIEVAGQLIDSVPTVDDSVLEGLAATRNPSLRIQTAEVARAEVNVQSIRKSRLPDFTVGPNVEYVRDDQIYGLSVFLPLPLWDSKKGEIAIASAEHEKALVELDRLRQEILRDVSAASENLAAAQESLSYFTPEFRNNLKTALDDASESYANGRTTLLIYLETLRTYFDTQADYFDTLQRLYDAQTELEAALGVPLTEL